MHQLTLFAPTEPTPAPTKKSFKAKPTPTKESGLEVDPNIVVKSPEPTQALPPALTQISLNQLPVVPTKPLPSNDLSGEEWVKEYYRMPEPINPGDRVRTPAGKEGIVTRWQLDENNLPNGLPRVDWNSPDVIPGLREAYVRTDGSDEEEGFYAYHLTKIKCGNSRNSITPTVSGDELSQEAAQEEETECTFNPEPSEANAPTLKEGDVVLWVKNFTRVRVEWIAINNTIAAVRDVSSKQAYNVPPSELQVETQSSASPAVNPADSQDSNTARDTNTAISNRSIISTTKPHSDPETNDAPKPLIIPTGKELKPETKEPSTTSKVGKILSFSITTERAAAMGVPDPLIAGIKICTRRAKWTSPTIAYYQRAYEEGLLIQAYSAMPFVTCKNPRKMADIRLTRRPYLEALGDMPEEDLIAEGGLWRTREEFIHTVCNGKPDPSLKVWVNWFEVVNICA